MWDITSCWRRIKIAINMKMFPCIIFKHSNKAFQVYVSKMRLLLYGKESGVVTLDWHKSFLPTENSYHVRLHVWGKNTSGCVRDYFINIVCYFFRKQLRFIQRVSTTRLLVYKHLKILTIFLVDISFFPFHNLV